MEREKAGVPLISFLFPIASRTAAFSLFPASQRRKGVFGVTQRVTKRCVYREIIYNQKLRFYSISGLFIWIIITILHLLGSVILGQVSYTGFTTHTCSDYRVALKQWYHDD